MERVFNKPVIVISKCIEHGHCRYDGTQISSPFIKNLEDYVEFIPVCPEVAMGLSIPREAVRVVLDGDEHKLILSQTGGDVTKLMNDFSEKYLNSLKEVNIHGFILKNRSPSCGIKDVKMYKTYGKASAIGKASGFFGREVVKAYEDFAIEDEGRLMSYNIREHFLTRIFTFAKYDDVIKANKMKDLIKFHSQNKYLLMAYHQKNQKLLGKIVANHEAKKVEDVIVEYLELLRKSLEKPSRRGTNINMLMHLLGYFKNDLNKEEKSYFLDVLEQYSAKKVPFSVPISLIYSWVIRFEQPYLMDQTIFRPYPIGILDVNDSGKGID